jgi:hypothetical protein
VVTLVALVHRLLFLHAGYDTGWSFSLFYEGDTGPFFGYARAILDGRPYDGGVPFHPPGFPHLLAAIHALLGAADAGSIVPNTAVRVVVAAISSLAAGLVVLLVRGYLGLTAAVLAGLAWAYAFGGYVIATSPVSEGPYQVVLLAAVLVWSRRLDHPLAVPTNAPRGSRKRWALALGLLLALLALIRAEGMLLAPVLVGAGLAGARGGGAWRRTRLVEWGIVAGAFVLALTPWTVRNHLRLSEINVVMASRFAEPLPTLVPLTAYGPLNLALANNARADGTFSRALLPDPTGEGTLDLTRPDHLEVFLRGDELAWRWIREHPAAFGRLVLRKWALAASAMRLGWLQWNVPGGLAGIRRPVDCFVPGATIGAGILWGLLVVGSIRLWLDRSRAGRRYLAVCALVLLVPLVACGLFFGYARLVVIVLPFLYAIAVVPLADLLGWASARSGALRSDRAVRIAAATALAALLVVEAIGSAPGDRAFAVTGTLLEGQGVLNPHENVLIRPAEE